MDVKNKSILLFCAVAVILLIAVLIAVPVLSGENIETEWFELVILTFEKFFSFDSSPGPFRRKYQN